MNEFYISDTLKGSDGIGVFPRELTVPENEHTHMYFDTVIVKKGSGCVRIGNRNYDVGANSLVFIDRFTDHSITPTGKLVYSEILHTPEFYETQNESEEYRRIFYSEIEYFPAVSLNDYEAKSLLSLSDMISKECAEHNGDHRQIIRQSMSLFAAYVRRAADRTRAESENRDPEYIVTTTLEYVDKHFTENISQDDLASRFHYNTAYFSRMFKKHKGMNFSDYITKKRIDLACELLLETDLSAEAVSEKVGYKSKPQFYNTFTKITGVTPRQYRINAAPKDNA